jgi:hypothetical protein
MSSIGHITLRLLIEIVLDTDLRREITDVRSSTIYDIADTRLIIAQSDPPIPKNLLNKPATITYLVEENTVSVRYGFEAVFTGFITDYKLPSSQVTEAIKILRISNPEQYNLRLLYRVEPPSGSGIEVFIDGNKTNILDISIGGCKISLNGLYSPEAGAIVKAMLMIDGSRFEVDATIVRKWQLDDASMATGLDFVAMEFINVRAGLRNVLAGKILDIQRKLGRKQLRYV